MRVIGGSAKGRRLLTPKHNRIRPTADRVKESLFNILAVRFGSLDGCRVLDLFAGTGNLGIEALSRGAAEAIFIDESAEAVALVQKNLELTGFSGRARIVRKGALSALQAIGDSGAVFGLVFVDPPYLQGIPEQVLTVVGSSPLIDDNSVVVVETAAREALPSRFQSLEQFDSRVYGDTALRFYSLNRNHSRG